LSENKEDSASSYPSDLFTSYMKSWYEYMNAWSIMYTEYIRNTSKVTEFWVDAFSNFWSGKYKDKIRVE
jgi:hypothetical protein